MTDITLGQYYYGTSILHKLDPRTKLVCTLLFLLEIFLTKSIIGLLLLGIYLLVLIAISRLPSKVIFQGLTPIFFLIIATIIFQTLTSEGLAIAHLWVFTITKEGIINAVYMSLRLIIIVLGAAMMTYTTTPTQISDAIGKLLKPLGKLKLPVHELSFLIMVALKFIPILLDETQRIINAQISRGIDFDEKNILQKGKLVIPLLLPVFISLFYRSYDLGMAMDARCYRGGEHRSVMNPLVYAKNDCIYYVTFLLFSIFILIANIFYAKHFFI